MKTLIALAIGLALPCASLAADNDTLQREIDALRDQISQIAESTHGDRGGPRLSYDSGWVYIAPGETMWFDHNVGGNVDNYIVLCDSRPGPVGPISSAGFGVDNNGDSQYGFDWHSLTDETIAIYRGRTDYGAPRLRVRIITY